VSPGAFTSSAARRAIDLRGSRRLPRPLDESSDASAHACPCIGASAARCAHDQKYHPAGSEDDSDRPSPPQDRSLPPLHLYPALLALRPIFPGHVPPRAATSKTPVLTRLRDPSPEHRVCQPCKCATIQTSPATTMYAACHERSEAGGMRGGVIPICRRGCANGSARSVWA
jgi:hypothetical protein